MNKISNIFFPETFFKGLYLAVALISIKHFIGFPNGLTGDAQIFLVAPPVVPGLLVGFLINSRRIWLKREWTVWIIVILFFLIPTIILPIFFPSDTFEKTVLYPVLAFAFSFGWSHITNYWEQKEKKRIEKEKEDEAAEKE